MSETKRISEYQGETIYEVIFRSSRWVDPWNAKFYICVRIPPEKRKVILTFGERPTSPLPLPLPFTKLSGPRMDLHLRPQFTRHGGTKMRSLVFEEEERRSTLWLLSSRLESSGEKRFRERESLLASRLENCAFFELYIFFRIPFRLPSSPNPKNYIVLYCKLEDK